MREKGYLDVPVSQDILSLLSRWWGKKWDSPYGSPEYSPPVEPGSPNMPPDVRAGQLGAGTPAVLQKKNMVIWPGEGIMYVPTDPKKRADPKDKWFQVEMGGLGRDPITGQPSYEVEYMRHVDTPDVRDTVKIHNEEYGRKQYEGDWRYSRDRDSPYHVVRPKFVKVFKSQKAGLRAMQNTPLMFYPISTAMSEMGGAKKKAMQKAIEEHESGVKQHPVRARFSKIQRLTDMQTVLNSRLARSGAVGNEWGTVSPEPQSGDPPNIRILRKRLRKISDARVAEERRIRRVGETQRMLNNQYLTGHPMIGVNPNEAPDMPQIRVPKGVIPTEHYEKELVRLLGEDRALSAAQQPPYWRVGKIPRNKILLPAIMAMLASVLGGAMSNDA